MDADNPMTNEEAAMESMMRDDVMMTKMMMRAKNLSMVEMAVADVMEVMKVDRRLP